ncbi:MAG: TrkH family potassium uptake protein [Clostridia bacterium]|nr:TrkH family potassium uptake protein [Clostridia bacterium]
MNRRMIVYSLGLLVFFEGILMLFPALVSLIYREEILKYYLITALVLIAVGFIVSRIKTKDRMIFTREGLLTVSLGWIVMSLFGAIPFSLSGEFPTYIDAFFEMVSGFTTTGASVLSDVEKLSHASQFWRSFSHWIGGMGVLVFVMAAVKLASGGGNIYLLRAESPGAEVSKLVPSSRGTAKILYTIYIALTAIEFVILLFCGLDVFESVTMTLSTAGTGGFGIYNNSFAGFSPAAQIVVAIFMALFGVNFSCYYLIIARRFKEVLKSEELRAYVIIMLVATVTIAMNIANTCSGIGEAFRGAFFQVSSVMTTTGFSTMDFNLWPELSRIIMLIVMCIGACEGSTGGGLKVSRFILLGKIAVREIRHAAKPNAVSTVRYNGKTVSEGMVRNICSYFVLYVIVIIVSVVLVSFDGFDTVSNVSGVIATVNNIGPGLEMVGATGNFGSYSLFSKLVFSFDMLFGRLELFPMFALFSLRTWRR